MLLFIFLVLDVTYDIFAYCVLLCKILVDVSCVNRMSAAHNTFKQRRSVGKYEMLRKNTNCGKNGRRVQMIVSDDSVQCFAEKHDEGHGGFVYIFCDCQKAIDVLTQHHMLIKHPEVCVKVKHLITSHHITLRRQMQASTASVSEK